MRAPFGPAWFMGEWQGPAGAGYASDTDKRYITLAPIATVLGV